MSKKKQEIRENFRNSTFKRDNYICVMCEYRAGNISELDAHHIYDRTLMPNGGYVKENGITLCKECHIKAESTHNDMEIPDGFTREELYERIGSTREVAVKASEKLK